LRINLLAAALICATSPVVAQDAPAQTATMSAAQLFAFADRARDSGDYRTAETAYRALAGNPDIELRTEARFRLALMLADKEMKYREAAVLLREILDEKPDVARVRLELARMQAQMGNLGAAERELRAAEAAGLPPEVERMVRFYTAALSSHRPYGANVEIAVAPDSNINRATRSETLGTIIGDFDLSEDARAQSGLGLSTQGQVWGRIDLSRHADLLARVSGSGTFYRRHLGHLPRAQGPRFRADREARIRAQLLDPRALRLSPGGGRHRHYRGVLTNAVATPFRSCSRQRST
jgi:tetratricopeptide (TPR) repeat protein